MKTILLSILFLGVLASCAHHRDVRPGSGGLHSVAVMSETKEKGARNAISQANHFCKERGKYATIEKEEATYVGSMSEEDYNKAKTAMARKLSSIAFKCLKERRNYKKFNKIELEY